MYARCRDSYFGYFKMHFKTFMSHKQEMHQNFVGILMEIGHSCIFEGKQIKMTETVLVLRFVQSDKQAGI